MCYHSCAVRHMEIVCCNIVAPDITYAKKFLTINNMSEHLSNCVSPIFF